MSTNVVLDGLQPVEVAVSDFGLREDVLEGTDDPNLNIHDLPSGA